MPAVTAIEGLDLVSQTGERLGDVTEVLFDPREPRAVALMVERDRRLGVVARAPLFFTWADVSIGEDAAVFSGTRPPSRAAVGKALGIDPDETVIWRGMPVTDSAGERIGTVGDVSLGADGSVTAMCVSSGVLGDAAHGRIQVPGDAVKGFDGNAVVVDAAGDELRTGGGAAAAAGKKAVAAKEAAGEAAKAAGDALVGASYAAGRAIGKIAKAKRGDRARKALRGIADAYREGRDGK